MLFSTVQVYIHVHNQLMTDSATIHWHGINMKGINNTISGATPWSDGVPYVTQCPILPGATFTHVYVQALNQVQCTYTHIAWKIGFYPDYTFQKLLVVDLQPMKPVLSGTTLIKKCKKWMVCLALSLFTILLEPTILHLLS